ncbi:MAG TPA: GNAT family N-acetyltransferase [Burkholderiaceae bacterium]|nr:GNAT family N-acetyltransferase [Burkholderiaceae bacterium]
MSATADNPLTLAEFGSLSTERLIVRPVEEGDLPDLLAVNGDAETTRFLPYAAWQHLDDARAWLQRMRSIEASGTALQLVVEQRSDGRVIGTVLLFKWDAASARIELGYVLARSHWGQGLMHEALRGVCARLFSALAIRRIEAEVDVANTASHQLLLRLGFAVEGRLRQRWVVRERCYDVQLYGLLATDPRPDFKG